MVDVSDDGNVTEIHGLASSGSRWPCPALRSAPECGTYGLKGKRAQRGAPSGACRRRLDQDPVWLGQVMDRACFLRPPAGGNRYPPQAIQRTAGVPDRSEPKGKDMVKKRVPGSTPNRAPTLQCNIIQFAAKNNALGWSFGDSPTAWYLRDHPFRRFRTPRSGRPRSAPPRNGLSPIRCRGRPAPAMRRGCGRGWRLFAFPARLLP